LFILACNLGNFVRMLAWPAAIKRWSPTSLRVRPIKTGVRLVRHASRQVFQFSEVFVTMGILARILERISRLRLAPG
jgi:hypothetical protein